MGIPVGTTLTYGVTTAGGNREDLEDTIWDLFADETYCLSNFDKVEANGTYHEWMTDKLVAAAANRQFEGDDAVSVSIVSPTRVGAYQQITRKAFQVSRTQEKVAKAGRRRESARQVTKQMRELKNDIEYAIVTNQASTAGGTSLARSTAGMESWITTNEKKSTTSAAATTLGFSSGTVTAPTDGTTTAALTIGALNLALQGSWSSGGQASQILVGPTQKLVIDNFSSIATRFVDIDRNSQATITGAANVYVSSFGRHTVRMHRHVRASVVMCIDPDMWAISFIDRPFMEKLARTGDGDKYQIISEWGLVSRNEAANGKVVACS